MPATDARQEAGRDRQRRHLRWGEDFANRHLLHAKSSHRKLKATAEREFRPIGNLVDWIVVQHLRSHKKRLKLKGMTGPRIHYQVRVSFAPDEIAKLEARAEEQHRTVSNHVTLLVVEALGRK